MDDEPNNVNSNWKSLFLGELLLPSIIINFGILLYAINTFIIMTIMPTVVEDIGGTELYAWPIMIFTVGGIVGAASAEPIRVKFGQRDGFILAGITFLIGNLGAAFAPNMETLIFWRLIQGLGGGLIISQSFGVVGTIYPSNLRTRILSVISTTWGLATVVGPAFGGIFAEAGSWRFAFLVLVPITLIFCILVWYYIENIGKGDKVEKFPITRLSLFAFGILSIGLTSQTNVNGYRFILIFASIAMISFALRRDAFSTNRMFPKKTLIPNTAIGSSYWFAILFTCTFIFALMYSTLYLQMLHQQTPLNAAYISAALSFAWTITAIASASLEGFRTKIAIILGGILMVLGAIGLSIFAVNGPIILIIFSFGLIGSGIGISNIHVMALSMDCAEEGEGTLVASSIQTIRNMGLAFGSALVGLIANMAGLTEGASVVTVSRAVDFINIATIVVAALTVASLFVFIICYEKETGNH
ncbi:MAG: MFS transporter [Pseudomonadota bacterium]|nr:MFS transporter [Pseudomonadota bacterium]